LRHLKSPKILTRRVVEGLAGRQSMEGLFTFPAKYLFY